MSGKYRATIHIFIDLLLRFINTSNIRNMSNTLLNLLKTQIKK